VLAAVCLVASVGFIWMASGSTDEKPAYAHEPIVSNSPIGNAIGVNPGRVAWIRDANATNWSGGTTAPFPYENICTDQAVVNEMFSKGIRALAGEYTDADAWDAVFRNFNQRMGKGDVGYTPGEKIAIKINFVLMYSHPSNGEMPDSVRDQISNSPQLAIALLKQLIDVVGVSPGDISIGDAQMMMPNHWYNMVYAQCPGVVYMTRAGVSHDGRTAVTLDYSAPFYWSDPCAAHWSGVTQQDYIPTHLAQSDYFINFPILKSHNSGGITVSGKNHYGSLSRTPNASGYYNMHNTRPYNADSSPYSTPGMGYYRANVDLMGHPKLGGKTMLVLIDGLFAGRSWDSQPIKWDMAPFNTDWPSSIFLSQDQVAADSVAFDFMDYEWDTLPPTNINGHPQYSGTDDYLHEAALIPDPPSGAVYDPNDDGGLTESLGVHEHWNNATDKQYSRNLDPVYGIGIELVTGPERIGDFDNNGRVDFKDFAILALAWQSTTIDSNWDPDCDISMPSDGIIDELDLKVFCDNWLNVYVTDLIAPGATLEEVYSATGINFEGPTWDPVSDKLFFTRRNTPYQILRLDSPGNVTVWLTPSPATNGTIMSLDGRLLCCDESPKQITSRRIDPNGPGDTQILADSNDGFTKPPNDLCQLANGNIYFTTPIWDSNPPSSQGVWMLKPNGAVTQVNNTLYQPNGIITSLDETKLYVSAGSTVASNQKWWVFDINTDGTLSAGSVFFNPASAPDRTNVPDGITIDEMGNLYFTGLGGVWIVSPKGVQLDFISLPNAPFNIAFGGPNGRTLYMTCKNKVYSLAMCVRGGELSSW
ncbi:MAG: SMP-30/gluconolactonase/LRE family protein, partial [Sedimentisphaerales bacterium]|nr:SMP-30/gluconolactonase/LRE family protein [Sedimentisphaerales bacterium]